MRPDEASDDEVYPVHRSCVEKMPAQETKRQELLQEIKAMDEYEIKLGAMSDEELAQECDATHGEWTWEMVWIERECERRGVKRTSSSESLVEKSKT